MQSTDTMTLSFDAWLSALRDVCGNFDSIPLDRQSFRGDVSRRSVGGIEIADITTNAERVVRSRPHQHDDDRHCFLIVQKQGHATLVQNGVSIAMRPGEMLLMDSARACEIFPHGLIEHESFHLPRGEVARQFGRQPVPFMKIVAGCTSGQIMQLIVNRMVSGPLAADAQEQESGVANSLIALLPAIYQHQAATPSLFDQAGSTLYLCIQQFIDQHLHEDELGPERLASQFHVSIRQLYRLFERHDETVCRYVQRRRLARCGEELANPMLADRSITQIAYKWGFTDSAHFSRAFKREFSSSPRDYRRSQLAKAA
ncbi:transcriptional regulator FeaR [Modicisalibacter radicis]|uniref:transcriptional regulator FeaR n=1 Tax=Halomonas sp. EAR18 TaxID=2518972 RepID=UPI00109D8088|nr:transcriptional regulator FeaR [Halomonas sp. EAR18]